jgi:hypothetical protein
MLGKRRIDSTGTPALKRITLVLLFGYALLLCSSIGALAGQLEGGEAAFKKGDYATALKLWRPLAEQGLADAQYNLGRMYDYGWGVVQDFNETSKWYRLAAAQGNANAQHSLGDMYILGTVGVQDYKEAVKWYRLAAEQGFADAQNSLGAMYWAGWGVAQDYVRAYMWFSLGASSLSGEKEKGAANDRDAIAAKMTPAQIEQAQAMAHSCQQSNYKQCD